MLKFYKKYLSIFSLWIILSSFNGFEYRNIKTVEPLSIHVIEIDPSKYEIFPALANDNTISRETVLEIAKRKKAIAAINGGFWKIDGRPAGILKIDKQWIALPTKQRAAIGWDKYNSIFMIDQLDAKATIMVDNLEFLVNGINRPRINNERILYLFPFYNTFKDQNNLSMQVLSHDFFLAYEPSDRIFEFIRFNNFDYKVDIFPKTFPSQSCLWEKLDHIVGGVPFLICNREKILDFSSEKTFERFLIKKYARTAIGIKENGNLLFVVVDNDSQNSIGLTIDEPRDLMYNLGSIYALNLDGGGSSTMVINDKLVNKPAAIPESDFYLANKKKCS